MPQSALDVWVQRTGTLESALRRAGRDDLLPAVTAVGRLLALLIHSGATDVDAAMPLIGRTLAQVRQCVMDRSISCEPTLVGDLEAMCHRITPARAPADDALSLLASLGDAGDEDLDALLDSVGKIERAAPRDELGTLREPITGMRRPEGAARVLMKGELHPGLLSDLIQLFAQNMETGRLVIDGDGTVANVYFKDGKIVDAECGAETGEKAFFLSMLVREGRFSYQRSVEAPAVRIFRTAQHLIMDTLRLMDESS
jgi:hypothetical protein